VIYLLVRIELRRYENPRFEYLVFQFAVMAGVPRMYADHIDKQSILESDVVDLRD
jgi:hypothetical protein